MGKNRKLSVALSAGQGAASQQARVWQGQVGREPALFSPSPCPQQQVFYPSYLFIFHSSLSPLPDACRVEKLRYQEILPAHVMKSWKVSLQFTPRAHAHGWSLAPWGNSPSHCMWEEARINIALQCMPLVLQKKCRQKDVLPSGSTSGQSKEPGGRNSAFPLLPTPWVASPQGSLHLALTLFKVT